MKFDLAKSIEVLEKTPEVLDSLLRNLPESWTHNNEGGESWSPFTVLGHLVHGERTDWIPRTKITLENDENKSYEPFDRFAQFQESEGKNINDLLDEFKDARRMNLKILEELKISDEQLGYVGSHPSLGKVTLRHLLSTWVVHDLGHIAQISRVMAKQYKGEVGPWNQYMAILHDRESPSGR